MPKAITRSVALAVVLLPALAAAQQLQTQRPQPLVINPALPPPAQTSPTAPFVFEPPTPAGNGLKIPELGATVSPSLSRPGAPDPIPGDRRQEAVPTFRLRVPL